MDNTKNKIRNRLTENQLPQYTSDEDIKIEDCNIMECGWNRNEKCKAGIIHINKDGYPDKCE